MKLYMRQANLVPARALSTAAEGERPMKILTLAAGLLLCTPVLASPPDYTHNGQTPDHSGSGAGAINPMEGGLSYKDNCRQLIERASHLTDPTAPDAAE